MSQARIAFLQGERKGQENLKQDLVRRIKMLEFALKQERWVYELKYGHNEKKKGEGRKKKKVQRERRKAFFWDSALVFVQTKIGSVRSEQEKLGLFRAKFHKLKYGTELNQGDMKPPTFDDEKNGKYCQQKIVNDIVVTSTVGGKDFKCRNMEVFLWFQMSW